MTFDEKIENETQLIKELESSYPKLHNDVHFYDRKNTPWHIHDTKIRDAYWRRRMFITKRDGGDIQDTAKVY